MCYVGLRKKYTLMPTVLKSKYSGARLVILGKT